MSDTNEPSPRPWRVNSVTGGHISDANGDPVCFCIGSNCGERAALIVVAVNERDRLRAELTDKARNYEDVIAHHQRTEESLRDIVRRLADVTHSLLGNYEYRFRDDSNSMEWVKNVSELIRDARAAIGEDAP